MLSKDRGLLRIGDDCCIALDMKLYTCKRTGFLGLQMPRTRTEGFFFFFHQIGSDLDLVLN